MAKPSAAFFREPMALQLAQMRIKARKKRNIHNKNKRLTYDCMSGIVKGDSVVCKKRHKFQHVGRRKKEGLSLLSVLRGMSSSMCQICKDYDGETIE